MEDIYKKTTDENEYDIFEEDGNYIKTYWSTGDTITAPKINKIEDALYKISKNNTKTFIGIDDKINKIEDELYNINKNNTETFIGMDDKINNTFINIKFPPSPFVGAMGDGETDDTATIQAIIDNYDNIFIPKGVFIVSSLKIPRGKSIYGIDKVSSVIKGNKEGLNVIDCVCDSTGYEQYQIHNLLIDGGLKSNQGIHIERTTSSIHDAWANIYHIAIRNCRGDGLYIGNQIRECYIDTLEIRGCEGHGLTVESGATDNVFTNVVSHNNEKSGFYINGANNRFIGCKAYWNGRNFNAEQDNRFSGYHITSWMNKFTCCDSQENASHGFYIKDTNNIQLDCITSDRNGLPLTNWNNSSPDITYGSGVYVDNSRYVVITGVVRDFMKWSHGQTQKYGVTLSNSCSVMEIDIMSHDLEQHINIGSDTKNYLLRINGVEYFNSRTLANYMSQANYFKLTYETGRMGVDIFSHSSQYQIYSDNNEHIKVDTFKLNDSGDYSWTGTPLWINNNGDIHLGRHNTKIGFFDEDGINRIQAPSSAKDLESAITLANDLRQILIDYGLLG